MPDTDPPTGWEQPVADRDVHNWLATIEDTLLRMEGLLIEIKKLLIEGRQEVAWDQPEPAQAATEAKPVEKPRRPGRPKSARK